MTASHLLLLPILLPPLGAVVVAFLRSRTAAAVVLLTCLLTLVAAGALLQAVYLGGPQTYRLGGWAPPYGIVLVADLFGATLAATSALLAAVVALHALATGGELLEHRFYHPLFLLLLMALGGVFLTGDLFNLYVFMELVILSSFPLVAMSGREVSAEATFKYAVLAALGSALLLIAVALVYAAVGTLNLADIALRVREGEVPPFWSAAAALMLGAFLLKAAIFPFHFWQPDAHSAAPAPVSAMLSGILVKVGFYGIVRMDLLLFPASPVLEVLVGLGAVSALFGGLAGLANPDLKRMLAYSTISNMGFVLLALGWGGEVGVLAALVNAVNHAFIKGGLFLSGGYVTERLDEHRMERLAGVIQLTPAGTIAFGVGALALAGLPPLSGFLSKLTLFQAGVAAGDAWLLGAAVLASALGIAYPVRAFVRVFWGEAPPWAAERWSGGGGGAAALAAPLLLALLYLLVGAWPGPLLALASAAARELHAPEVYITAVLGSVR